MSEEFETTTDEEILDALSPEILSYLNGEEDKNEEKQTEAPQEVEERDIENLDSYIEYFKEALDKRAKTHLAQLVRDGYRIYAVKAEIPSGAMMGIQVFMLMEKLSDGGEILSTLPDGKSISNGVFDDGLILLLAHREGVVIPGIFNEVFNVEPYINEINSETLDIDLESAARVGKMGNEQIDSLINHVEDLLLYEDSVTMNTEDTGKDNKNIDEIKVKVTEFNQLFQLIEELVLIRNQFIRVNESKEFTKLHDIQRNLDRTTDDLYKGVLSLKMVPVGQIFNHMRQYTLELAEKTGKKIDFIINGADVHVDRNKLEELVEPIKGLISNAVVHGVEDTDKRLEKGKHSVGTISIHAESDDTSIIISIEDDGVGLDTEAIKNTALSLGLTSQKILDGRKDGEFFDLLTLPGYTTKEFGEDICPDAMGLNAIKQRVEAKGGRFEIHGAKNKGAHFRVILPTNLAIKRVKRVLLFGVGHEIYATPASMVHMVVNMDQHPVKTKIEDVPYIKFRENVIPFYKLGSELDIDTSNEEPFGIILRKDDEECCVSVSEIIGFEGVAIKSAQDLSLNFTGIMGLTVLSDGRATPILDLWSIIHG